MDYRTRFYYVLGLFVGQFFKRGGTTEQLKDQHPDVFQWVEEAYKKKEACNHEWKNPPDHGSPMYCKKCGEIND